MLTRKEIQEIAIVTPLFILGVAAYLALIVPFAVIRFIKEGKL